METFIALVRGINVGGNRALPMAATRACLSGAGFGNVRSYIASGNLLIDGKGSAPEIEARVEAAVLAALGTTIVVIARTAATWGGLIAANPLPEPARERPKLFHLGLSKQPLREDAAAAVQSRLIAGETVVQAAGALWFDYANGVTGSKLSPAQIDRAAGSTVTARNWNTVLKLAEMSLP